MAYKTLAIAALAATLLSGAAQAQIVQPVRPYYVQPAPQPFLPPVQMAPPAPNPYFPPFGIVKPPLPGPQPMLMYPMGNGSTGGYQ